MVLTDVARYSEVEVTEQLNTERDVHCCHWTLYSQRSVMEECPLILIAPNETAPDTTGSLDCQLMRAQSKHHLRMDVTRYSCHHETSSGPDCLRVSVCFPAPPVSFHQSRYFRNTSCGHTPSHASQTHGNRSAVSEHKLCGCLPSIHPATAESTSY